MGIDLKTIGGAVGTFFGGPVGGAIGSVGGSLLGSMLERDQAKDDAQQQQIWSAESQARQMDFQREMSNTSWQRGVADMKAAGLNPMLAYSQGGAPAPGGSAFTAGQPRGVNFASNLNQGIATASQIEVNDAQAKKLEAEEADIRARIPTHAVNIDRMRQEISESVKRIEKMEHEIKDIDASAAQRAAATDKLRAELPQIEATIKHLKSLAALEDAKLFQVAEETNLTKEKIKELRQKIVADLPDVERAIGLLRARSLELGMPQKAAEAQVHGTPLGTISAFLKAIIPLTLNFKGALD